IVKLLPHTTSILFPYTTLFRSLSSQHDASQPMSLRERKKRLAQATIEEAALRLFQQKGYEQTSIQDIADAVMMSTRTFFRYFARSEEHTSELQSQSNLVSRPPL